MKLFHRRVFTLISFIVFSVYSYQPLAEKLVISKKVTTAPLIDGQIEDSWQQAQETVTYDALAETDIRIKSVYTDDEVFFLIRFKDATENRFHKKLVWDKSTASYKIGPTREDTVVLKWNLEAFPVDLTVSSDQQYSADIWYWKSFRTDHANRADDKYQVYSSTPSKKGHRVISKKGRIFYLTRKGDKGRSAYKNNIPIDFKGKEISGYELRAPRGSRADVRAKGVWKDGMWTVEFTRKLDTGQIDDVYFEKELSYQFGVSRYEIAGRKKVKGIENPLFGSGEITEHLILKFK